MTTSNMELIRQLTSPSEKVTETVPVALITKLSETFLCLYLRRRS